MMGDPANRANLICFEKEENKKGERKEICNYNNILVLILKLKIFQTR